jgi:photosystem II stability/assembly factor-like uncharacterized protein
VGTGGTILKTTNAGVQWKPLNSRVTENLSSVYFSSPEVGCAVGSHSVILTTRDGGASWTNQLFDSLIYLRQVIFPSARIGYAIGGVSAITIGTGVTLGIVLKTTDGGVSWFNEGTHCTDYLYSAYFLDTATGYAVGDNGSILATADGGVSWTNKKSVIFSNVLKSVYFTDYATGYVCGVMGTIMKTIDSATTWKNVTNPASGSVNTLNCLRFLTGQIGDRSENRQRKRGNPQANRELENRSPLQNNSEHNG